MLRKEGAQADDRATRANLALEIVNERPYRVNQLLFALTERQLLVLDIVDLILILLDEFCVPFCEQ